MPSLVPAWAVTWVDASGSVTTTRGHLGSGNDQTAALAALEGLAGAASSISGCSALRISVSYLFVIDDNDSPPSGDSDVSSEGLFVFTTDDGDNLAIVAAPGFRIDKTETEGCFAGERINLLDSDIAAFVTALSDGDYTDPFANDLVTVEAAFIRKVR